MTFLQRYIFCFLLTIPLLGMAQTHYSELDFYNSDWNAFEANEAFTLEIANKINSSTEEAQKIAILYKQYAVAQGDSFLILHAYYQNGVVHYTNNRYDSALYYENESNNIAKRRLDSMMLVNINRTLGAIYFTNKENFLALKHYNLSYEMAVAIEDSIGMAKALNNLSIMSSDVGDYENSLNYLKRALDLKIAYADKSDRISTLLNIGQNYFKLENYDKAKEYFTRAENIAKQFDERHKLSVVYRELAKVEIAKKNYIQAESLFKKSIKISESLEDQNQLITTWKEFGEYWILISQWEKAKSTLQLILKENEKPDAFINVAEVYYDFGKIYYETNNMELSHKWLQNSIMQSNENQIDVQVKCFLLLAKIAEKEGDYENGFYFLNSANQLNDSLSNQLQIEKLRELKVKYGAENDKKYIENLVQLTEQKEKESSRSQLFFIIASILFIISFIAAIALYLQVRIKRKKSKELETQIEENLRKTKDLIEANKKAEEGLRVKSEFIAMVSHEIRTPMNAIIGMTSLLFDTVLSDKQKNFLNNITISSNNLLILLNDILDFSRVESGKVKIKIQQSNLKKELNHIIDTFEPLAQDQGLKFESYIDEAFPEFVFVDAPRLRQVLLNLLSNAIKFTHSGFVKLNVKILNSEPTLNGEKILIRFMVQDSGIGVPEEKQSEIFSSFNQLDSKVSRKYSGVGLGLSISQGILGMMGSSIQLKSQFAEGSTFWFDMSLKTADKKEKITQNTKSKVKFNKELGIQFPLRILVAEDNEINQKLIQINLNKMGYNPTIVKNGQEALDQLLVQPFDIVFMDVQMPVMDGVTATKEIIRKMGSNKPVIVAVTANAMGTDKQSYIEAGMDDYVSKPYTTSELESCLRTWYIQLNN